jgi:hypothetical protein
MAALVLAMLVSFIFSFFIPKLLEDACFRMLEKNMVKAPLFINGYSLIK